MKGFAIILAIVAIIVLVSCAFFPEKQPREHFLKEGESAILILDLSVLAKDLREMRFKCTQGTDVLTCVWLE